MEYREIFCFLSTGFIFANKSIVSTKKRTSLFMRLMKKSLESKNIKKSRKIIISTLFLVAENQLININRFLFIYTKY